MTKTIIELCRALPDSEAELRARADEFNETVYLSLGSPEGQRDRIMPDYIGSIADAKAATDALLKLGARSLEIYCRDADAYCCGVLVRNLSCGYAKWVKAEAEASTEPLARSACALLAANALST